MSSTGTCLDQTHSAMILLIYIIFPHLRWYRKFSFKSLEVTLLYKKKKKIHLAPEVALKQVMHIKIKAVYFYLNVVFKNPHLFHSWHQTEKQTELGSRAFPAI